MRRGLEAAVSESAPTEGGTFVRSKVTGLPLVRFPRPVTPEDVRALDDEA